MRLKRQRGELAAGNGNAQHLGQLIYKAARSGGTGLVHLVVDDDSVALDNQLGVLSADFDNIGVGINMFSGPGLRRNLVSYHVGANKAAD